MNMNRYQLQQLIEQLGNLPIYVRDADGNLFDICEISTVVADDDDRYIAISFGE